MYVKGHWKSENISGSVASNSLGPHGLWPTRLLCPWNSLSKNSGVGCHSLLHAIFLTQGLNSGLLYCRQILYFLSHQGSINVKTDNFRNRVCKGQDIFSGSPTSMRTSIAEWCSVMITGRNHVLKSSHFIVLWPSKCGLERISRNRVLQKEVSLLRTESRNNVCTESAAGWYLLTG